MLLKYGKAKGHLQIKLIILGNSNYFVREELTIMAWILMTQEGRLRPPVGGDF